MFPPDWERSAPARVSARLQGGVARSVLTCSMFRLAAWLSGCLCSSAVVIGGMGCNKGPAGPQLENVTTAPPVADTREAAAAVSAGESVADVASRDTRLCLRLTGEDWRCFEVSAFGPLSITPLVRLDVHRAQWEHAETLAVSRGAMTLVAGKGCFAEGKTVRCPSLLSEPELERFPTDHRHKSDMEIAFPVAAVELVTMLVEPGHHELCGRSAQGEVHCVAVPTTAVYLDENGNEIPRQTLAGDVLFTQSSAVRLIDGVLFSLREDGGLECAGRGGCGAMIDAANYIRTGAGGSAGGMGLPPAGGASTPTPNRPVTLESLAKSWPQGPERIPNSRGLLPVPPATRLLSAGPCVELRDAGSWCWSGRTGPHPFEAHERGDDYVGWGQRFCTPRAQDIACVPSPLAGQEPKSMFGGPERKPRPSVEAISLPIPNAERLVRTDRALCAVGTDRRLTCVRGGSSASTLPELTSIEL